MITKKRYSTDTWEGYMAFYAGGAIHGGHVYGTAYEAREAEPRNDEVCLVQIRKVLPARRKR